MKKFFILLIFISLLFFTLPHYSKATSGCCSWHGGVSYCDTSTGKQVCNDGSYSPSCRCAYIPPKPIPTPITISIDQQIINKINSVKQDYPTHHQGFRESLIFDLIELTHADTDKIGYYVYTKLPDL